nr:integrase, catalytic region, zinc finger, CCHC-type, peptidase aspartic, catalytic [Tanacetum cinerariifolium]
MRIPLLYRGEYSQWVERFMNYLEEQMDGEAMINCIKNGDQSLPRVTQVSIVGTSSTKQPPLKDKSMWSDQEKKIQKIDHLARSLLIQGLSNDIYFLIDSNKTAKDLWDALARHMLGSKYGEQDRKAAVLYDELKKITALLAKAFNRRKFYSKPANNNLRTSSTSQSANKKQEFVKTDEKKVEKKDDEKNQDMSKVKCYNCKKEGHFAKDCKKVKVKDYEYYKTKMLLAKKDKDEQVLLAEDQAWMESSSDSDQEISEVSYYLSKSESESEYETSEYYDNTTTYGLFVNDNDDQEIFHDCENFLENLIESQIDHNEAAIDHNDSEGIDKDLKNTILEKDFKISELEECVRKDLEIEKCLENLNVCENKLHKMGQINQTVHLIMPSKDTLYNGRKGIGFENPSYFEKAKDLRPTLYDERVINLSAYDCNDAMNVSCNSRLYYSFDENNLFIFDEVSVRNYPVSKMSFRKKPCDSMNVRSKSKLNKSLPRTVYRCLPKMQQLAEPVAKWIPKVKRQIDRISKTPNSSGSIFKWVPKVCWMSLVLYLLQIVQIYLWIIDSGCSNHMMGNRALLTNFVKKFLRTVCFGNNDFTVIAGYGDVVIGSMTIKKAYYVEGLGHNLFSVGQFYDKGHEVAFRNSTCFIRNEDGVDLLIGLPKMKFEKDHLCSACEQGKIHQKHHKSKAAFASNKPLYLLHMDLCGLMRIKSINGKRYVLVVVDDYSRLEEVRVPSSNTQSVSNNMVPNVDEASTSHNVFNERLEDAYFDANTSFHDPSNVHTFYQPYLHEKKWTKDHPLHKIIGDPKSSVRTRGQLANSCLFSCLLSYIEPANVAEAWRDVHWVSAMQDELDQFARLKVWRFVPRPEGKTIIKTKWIFKNKKDERSLVIRNKARLVAIVQIFLSIIHSGCSKHMTGNRALLTNFVEKFLGTVRFGNNDFAVIAGYGDVVIGSMTIKKVCYVEGLGHNLFSVGQFCGKGLEVVFRKSTCFVQNEDGVDLLTGDRSLNLYTIAFNEVASNSSTCLLAKLLLRNLGCGINDIGVFVGYLKVFAAFRIYNKRTCKIYESVNVNFDEISEMASKQFSLEPGLSNLNETGKSSNPSVSQVSETSKKYLEDLFQIFYDEYFDSSKIMKSSTTNVETSNVEVPSKAEEVFHESFESFQEESSSSSLNDDVQQSLEEVGVPSSNTQLISNNMIPNVDESSTSHEVFNERLEDAYFDASTSFHDPSNVHTFYQPYPHEKKWSKDHPLYKIIGDLKASVRTRGQLENSCLFLCLLSSIEPANVAEALRDADWVNAM